MIYCTNCGTQNIDGVKFCINCGAALTSAASSSTAQPGGWRGGSSELNNPASSEAERPASGSGYISPSPQTDYPAYIPGAPDDLSSSAYGTTAGLQYATWVERAPGALIDIALNVVVFGFLYVGFFFITSVFGAISETMGSIVGCFGIVLVQAANLLFGVFNKIYLVSQRGSSIGQGVTNLKVVTSDNSTPKTGALTIRLIASIALGFVPCVGVFLDYLWPLWDPQRQTLHDKAAGTFVVKKS